MILPFSLPKHFFHHLFFLYFGQFFFIFPLFFKKNFAILLSFKFGLFWPVYLQFFLHHFFCCKTLAFFRSRHLFLSNLYRISNILNKFAENHTIILTHQFSSSIQITCIPSGSVFHACLTLPCFTATSTYIIRYTLEHV